MVAVNLGDMKALFNLDIPPPTLNIQECLGWYGGAAVGPPKDSRTSLIFSRYRDDRRNEEYGILCNGIGTDYDGAAQSLLRIGIDQC